MINNFNNTIPQVSKNVDTLFKQTDKGSNFFDLIKDFYSADNFKNDPFKDFVDGLDNTQISAMTAGDALEQYKKHLQETSKATSKLASLKGIAKGALGFLGASALNIGASMAATYAIDFAIKKWDEYANAQEHAIEAGEKASSKIKENYDSIASSNQWKNTNLERFIELAKGVSSAGMNMSLSTDEFAEYQTLASGLADTLPNLVTGFNNLGQPIIKAATDIKHLNQAFRDNDVKKYKENIKESKDVLKAFQAQYDKSAQHAIEKSGQKQKQAAYKAIIDKYYYNEEQKKKGKEVDDINLNTIKYDGFNNVDAGQALNELGIKVTTEEIEKNIDTIVNAYESGQQKIEEFASSVKSVLPSYLNVSDDYINLISKNANISDLMQSTISSFDAETVQEFLTTPEQIESWAKNVTKGLENSEVQSSINQLFSLDKHKSEMSFKDYKKYANELSDFIGKNVEGISENQIKKGLGIDDYLTDFESTYNKLKDIDKEFADTIKIEDYALAEKIISEQDISTVEEFTAALALAKQEAGSFSLNSFVSEVGNAMALVDQLNAALANSFTGKGLNVEFEVDKESGLITLTGDIENLKNAYQDLDGYDPSLLFEKTANGVHVNREALRALQAQEEALNKKKWMQDKIDLQKKLNEAIKIQQGLEQGTPEWYNSQDSIDSLKSQIETVELLSSAYDGATSAYQKWLAAQSGGEEGDMFRTVSETMKERGAELYKEGRYNTEEFRAIANYFSYEDLSTAPIEKLVEAYKQASNARDRYFTGNKQGIDNFMHDMETISKNEGKNWIKETEDGFIEFDTGADEEIAKRFNLSKEAVQAIFRAASEYNDKIRIGDTSSVDDLTQKLQEATEKANQAKESLKSLQEEGKISTDIKFDVDVSELDNVDIDERISSLEKLKEEAIIKFGADSSEVEYVNQLLDEANLRKQQLENETVAGVSVQINNESDIETLGQKLSSLPKDETTNVSIDIQNEEQLDNVVNQVNTIPQDTPVNISFSVSNEEQAFALKEKLDSGDKEITYTINYTDNSGQASELTKDGVKNVTVNEVEGTTVTKNDESKTVTVNYTLGTQEPPVDKSAKVNYEKGSQDNPSKKNANVDYKLGSQANPSSPKTATVNYTLGTVAKPPAANVKVNYLTGGVASGTMLSPAHTNGTAYNTLNMSPAHAGGNVAIQRDEKALVNELSKPESIVRDGIWSIIPGGAHVEQLKKGDIIFNGEQTEQLLKYGRIAGHGNAYADGTVGNVRNIISTPLTTAYSKGSWVYGNTGNGNIGGTGYTQKSDKTTNQISKNTKRTADTVKDISNELSNYEDWIERRFKAIESEFAHLEAEFARMSHLPDRLAKAYDLLAKNKEYINTVNYSKNTYQEHLDRIKGQGLSQDIIDKIQNGSLEISNYSEETKKLISEYETYYNKLRDCSSQYDELLAKQAELVQSTLDSITDYYDMMNGVDEASKDILEAQRELYEKLGVSVTAQDQKDYVNNSIKEQEKITDRLAAQIEAYASQIESLISSGYMERYSKEYYAAHETLNGLKQELLESQSALVEFQDKLYELEYAGIQNLINGFERAVDKLDAKIAYIKSKDEKVSESIYQEQINSNNSQIREKMKLKAKKEKEQALYDVGSTRYQELADEINNLDKETYKLLTTNEELKDSIFELRFADLEKEIKGYQDLRNEIEDFRSLLDEEAFFDKNGAITEDGLANLALLQQGMISAKKEIADYREGLDKLQESFDNGVISETEYNEKSAEYREGIRDSIKDVNDYEDSLKDLYITQMSKEVEALNEVIEKRKEALKRKADYYDYDKKLKSETKDVNLLKAQIAALDGSNNLSAKSEVKRLKEQLAEAEDQLNETKRQHSLDMQEQGYDGLSSDLEKMLEDTQYEITHNADKQQEVISNMLNNVVNMYANAYDKINSIIANTGFVGSSGFNTNQGQLGSQSGTVLQNNQATQHQSNVKPSGSAYSTVTKPIENDKNYHDKVEQKLDKKPNTDNRLVAEVKLSTTSITLEEGKTTRISCTVRPNDAKNKSILWDTSDTRIISVSDSGTITALRPGSCLVTAATLDGSGIKVSAGVTVTKKPEPPKPQPQAPSVSTGSGGDGKPNVGDAVTFVSGRYYYSSDGNSPSGNQMLGQTVYIGHINNKPWATRPYAIYRDKALKQGLGWVTLDQITGYKKGTKSVPKDGIAWTQEGSSGKSKPELIVRKKDGAIITDVHRGDAIIPNNLTENLFEWGALSPKQMFGDMMMKPVMTMINNKPELNVVNNYDSLIRVDGNVDNNVLTELKHYEKEFLNKSRDYTMNYFNRELRKGGFRK